MGLLGIYGAWQRMRAASGKPPSRDVPGKRDITKILPLERLRRLEHDVTALRNRQLEIHQETILQQSALLKQQAAMFDLLAQQRSALDKILTKMGGLS
jgi:hypothetical protein